MDDALLALGFGLVTASVIALPAIGFTLQFAIAGVFNLAYGEVMTVSALVAYVATKSGLGLGIGLLVGAACGAVMSLSLQRFLYLPFAHHGAGMFGLVVVSIAIGLIIQNFLQIITKAEYYSFPSKSSSQIRFLGMILTDLQVSIIGLTAVIVIGLQLLFRKTKFGRAIRATAVNPELARGCGIPTGRVSDVTWILTGALCGVGGVILGVNLVTFDFTTGTEFLIMLIATAVLGGIGNPLGAVLGAIVIGVSTELTALIDPSYKQLVAFVILGIVLLSRPQGIISDIAERKAVVL